MSRKPVTLALTMMVRDEADIVGAMLEHHLRQGVDVFIITENASIDGTADVIRDFARRATVDLRFDPEHRKQQSVRVTEMARDAFTIHGADWVINADADEFWFPVDRSRTLKEVVSELPPELRAFPVPVIDMVGPAAADGSGLDRLVYRDLRPVEEINRVGIHAHATDDVLHVGDPDVTVVQGNHYVSIASAGSPPPELAIEVLHLPWRSWRQIASKVGNAGRAYDSNPELTPSPNHHGMRDYRRLQRGTLLGSYLIRMPDPEQLEAGIRDGWFILDRSVADELLPGLPDVPVDPSTEREQRLLGSFVQELESRVTAAEAERDRLAGLADHLAAENAALRSRLANRIADALGRLRPGRS
ncbi:glycosyltransferase family 2 protein [Schumannella luteola]